ncbi:MAG TPA: glutamine--fructose-6-phosphate transaminase (isomerizing) [Verrucomicrobiae bacterium]|jgi:glucosamine--fructose-6-phosphate aminotransferase (isomerizing)|nr:glutamine--fructose-6-phosphate transaminase (isomerizing) [Verrucomicrobiae bacterium]
MCGIVGSIGENPIAPILVESIARLEYRGYDSCGLATINSHGIEIRKAVGAVEDVAAAGDFASAHGDIGIAHTRWATHGGVSLVNAHPHLSCDGEFAVVHNGIISNHQALRAELRERGHRFASETDTEILAHLLEETHHGGASVEQAFVEALKRLEGTFAIAMISARDAKKIYCARQQSPLILGLSPQTSYIASDVNAFLPYTRRAVLLEDGEYAVVARDGYCVRAIEDGMTRPKRITEIDWHIDSIGKAGHRHYMEKEICEQPETVRHALAVNHEEIAAIAHAMSRSRPNVLVGVGTTYYVALYGQYLLGALAGEFAPAISSDETEALAPADPGGLMLAISQSGETFDTLQALRRARAAGARTAAIVNVPGSSMTREADLVVQQDSGPEICVISTKAAAAQLVLLTRLAVEVARAKQRVRNGKYQKIIDDLCALPHVIQSALGSIRPAIRDLAWRYHQKPNWFFLARGLFTPMAYEAALKMKEVTYLHAEGMPAGFLKHGTLSLVDEETPCVFLIPPEEDKTLFDLTMSSLEEVRARKGKVIALAFDRVPGGADTEIILPPASPVTAPLLHLVAAQLLAYETALLLGRNIDRPRSLAKSVTVS